MTIIIYLKKNKTILEDLKSKNQYLNLQVEVCKGNYEIIEELNVENDELKKENDDLKEKNDEIEAENNELKKENDEFKSYIHSYQTKHSIRYSDI